MNSEHAKHINYWSMLYYTCNLSHDMFLTFPVWELHSSQSPFLLAEFSKVRSSNPLITLHPPEKKKKTFQALISESFSPNNFEAIWWKCVLRCTYSYQKQGFMELLHMVTWIWLQEVEGFLFEHVTYVNTPTYCRYCTCVWRAEKTP